MSIQACGQQAGAWTLQAIKLEQNWTYQSYDIELKPLPMEAPF